MITKVCEQCGRKYSVKPSKKDSSHFCSRECVNKHLSKNMCGKNNQHWKGGKVVKICEQCGREFEVYPSDVDRRAFCSKECYAKWRTVNRCGENGPGWKGGKVVKICEQCGREFEVKPYRKDSQRFCSRECFGEWQSKNRTGENGAAWKGGLSFEPYCHKFNETFKESIREKFGRICFLCSKTELENGRKLDVHHVNYDKDCLCDDSDCEFVPLCMRCHTKTNFNRDYWENLIIEKLEVI